VFIEFAGWKVAKPQNGSIACGEIAAMACCWRQVDRQPHHHMLAWVAGCSISTYPFSTTAAECKMWHSSAYWKH